MSEDMQAMKAEKASLIEEMLAMQQAFIAREHEGGISGRDYYRSDETLLKDYREEYMQKAMRVVELSHRILGSSPL